MKAPADVDPRAVSCRTERPAYSRCAVGFQRDDECVLEKAAARRTLAFPASARRGWLRGRCKCAIHAAGVAAVTSLLQLKHNSIPLEVWSSVIPAGSDFT